MEDCERTKVRLQPGTGLSDPGSVLERESPDGVKKEPYEQLVGCFLHLASTTRPDIAYSAVYFMHKPTMAFWKLAKHVLRYS